jgi:DNA invertase Pin-like site-specific DNA recombinase
MMYGYARVSTDGQTVTAQVAALKKAGAGKVFCEVASGAKTDRAQLPRLLDQLDAGDVQMVTRLDRLGRSTRDALNTFAAITSKKGGFRSLGDAWADTTTAHGRLVLTVLGELAEFERDLIRTRTTEGRDRAKARGVKLGRKPKLTEHQKREAMRCRDRDGEAMRCREGRCSPSIARISTTGAMTARPSRTVNSSGVWASPIAARLQCTDGGIILRPSPAA